MSLDAWVKEFYQVSAKICCEEIRHLAKSQKEGAIETLEHSIKKWNDLMPSNMRRHGMRKNRNSDYIVDLITLSGLEIDGNACALCQLFTCDHNHVSGFRYSCPIEVVKGKTCTDEYNDFRRHGIIKPMIELLEDTLKIVREGYDD